MEGDFKVSTRLNFGVQVNLDQAMNYLARGISRPVPPNWTVTWTIGTARRELPNLRRPAAEQRRFRSTWRADIASRDEGLPAIGSPDLAAH